MEHGPQANNGAWAGGKDDYFTVEVSTDTTRSRVRLVGDLDICTLPRLDAALRDLRGDGIAFIELDVGGLTFLCASALQVLLDTHTALGQAGGRLVVCNPGQLVRRILEITKLDTVLDLARPAARAAEPAGTSHTHTDHSGASMAAVTRSEIWDQMHRRGSRVGLWPQSQQPS